MKSKSLLSLIAVLAFSSIAAFAWMQMQDRPSVAGGSAVPQKVTSTATPHISPSQVRSTAPEAANPTIRTSRSSRPVAKPITTPAIQRPLALIRSIPEVSLGTAENRESDQSSEASSESLKTTVPSPNAIRLGPGLMLDLGPGMARPVAMLEPEKPLTPQQTGAMNKIVDDFIEEVKDAVSEPIPDGKSIEDIYRDARQRADARYRLLFGDDALNRASITAALEAGAGLAAPSGNQPPLKP